MYMNLDVECLKNKVTWCDMARAIHVTPPSIYHRRNNNDFKLRECIIIRDKFFPGQDIETLFKWEEETL